MLHGPVEPCEDSIFSCKSQPYYSGGSRLTLEMAGM